MSGPLSASDPGLRLVVVTIRTFLKEEKLACADMARATGIDQSVLSRALGRERGLSASSFRKLYAAYEWMRPILEIAVFMPEKAESILKDAAT